MVRCLPRFFFLAHAHGASGQARRAASSAAKVENADAPKTLTELEMRVWKLYFEETTADTAVPPPRRGIEPTVDTLVNTKDHPFITEPVLAEVSWGGYRFRYPSLTRPCQYHLLQQKNKQDPFLKFLGEFMTETEIKRKAKMRVKLRKILGIPQKDPSEPLHSEEKLRRFTLQYPWVADLQKFVAEQEAAEAAAGSVAQKKE
jgi:hypothetical protein